jgi:monofunctional biosynthetic peptidoglycan transglycosylase
VWRRAIAGIALIVLAFYVLIAGLTLLLRWFDPPTTTVQMERRMHALMSGTPYTKRYRYVPLARISPQLQRAVIAAEDAGFYQNNGIAWHDLEGAVSKDLSEGRMIGASTIEQQLARNLFLSTSRSLLRKAVEFTTVPFLELLLPKHRILELYLNVIEWGPGIYGAEAAAEAYYRIQALQLTRRQSIALAEILPAPLHRKPGQLATYGLRIQQRMTELGW